MKTMLRLTLERFELATEQEKPENYNRVYNKLQLLEATVEIEAMERLLVVMREFLTPVIMPREFKP